MRDNPGADSSQPAAPGWFPLMDAPEHTRYRRLLTGQFTVRRLKQLEPRIAEITASHLDAMAEAGPTADLVEAFALPVPSLVICELLGVPYGGDRELFHRQTAIMASIDNGLTEEELATVGLLFLVAGHETTANMLALSAFALLRYLTIVQFSTYRAALEDVELAGHLINKGETVTVGTWLSGTASTSASASNWPGWRCASASARCSPASRRSPWRSRPARRHSATPR